MCLYRNYFINYSFLNNAIFLAQRETLVGYRYKMGLRDTFRAIFSFKKAQFHALSMGEGRPCTLLLYPLCAHSGKATIVLRTAILPQMWYLTGCLLLLRGDVSNRYIKHIFFMPALS